MSTWHGMKILIRNDFKLRCSIWTRSFMNHSSTSKSILGHTVQNSFIPIHQVRSLSNCQKLMLQRTNSFKSVVKRWNSDKTNGNPAEDKKPPKPSEEDKKPPKRSKREVGSPVTWKTLGLTAAVGTVMLLYFNHVKKKRELELARERNASVGKAAIGGEWSLVDYNGEPKTDKDYQGKWLAIYFGFTHCPDICPDEIEKMCEVVDILGKTAGVPELVPLFVTVDPDRDSKEAVKKYCKEFSPKLLGLTGTHEQIQQVTRTFRVYYSKGPVDEDGDYIVDHTIVMYLISPKGEFVDYYGKDKTALQASKSIAQHMRLHKK